MSPQKPITPLRQTAPEKEDNLARSFNEQEEKRKAEREKIKQQRVSYVVKDLPIY